ncbi:MAG: diguanylate cyclase [Spirochaetia bacterium]|nr:diguanylate cyclase [Spirochaetia bacterium]
MGTFAATALLSGLTALLSVIFAVLLDLLLKGQILAADLVIGAVIPLLIAPWVLYLLVSLVHTLDDRETKLAVLAGEDPLTGALNRRSVLERAEHAFRMAERYQRPITVLMIDVDHFKQVNDDYGHKVGDSALLQVAQGLRLSMRNVDILGRYGGEEFVIVLPETAASAALDVAERLRRMISDYPLTVHDEHTIRITISVGVADHTSGVQNIFELVDRADQALYRAKRAGRDRCEIFDPTHPPFHPE